jgi:phage antirepressor YoqD-like protein
MEERTLVEFKRVIEKRYGLLLGINEVSDLLRIGKKQSFEWLKDVSYILVNGRQRWSATDIAEKLFESVYGPETSEDDVEMS